MAGQIGVFDEIREAAHGQELSMRWYQQKVQELLPRPQVRRMIREGYREGKVTVRPNFGTMNTGPKIEEGMCLAIEPMLNQGSEKIRTKEDGWTICTLDGKPSANFEHTVPVTKEGVEILTI